MIFRFKAIAVKMYGIFTKIEKKHTKIYLEPQNTPQKNIT